MYAFLIPFALAAGVVALTTPLVRILARATGVVAIPKADRWHRQAIPLLGGVALCAGTFIPLAFFRPLNNVALGAAACGALMFVLGLVDDVLQIKPGSKLASQIVIACVPLYLGYHVDWTASDTVNAVATILWVVGVTNAFNLLDNMDGLSAGIAAIAAVSFCGVVNPGHPSFRYAALIAGASSGFLLYNFRPASIFMGDSGSLFLGGTLAVLALAGTRGGAAGLLSTMAVPGLLMLIPIFDTAFVTVSRKLSSRSASVGGRDHTSHRLVALGFSERQAVLVLYSLAASSGLAAVAIVRSAVPEAGLIVGLLVIALALLSFHLARVRVYGDQDFAALRDKPFTPLLFELTYRRRVFEVLLDMVLVTVSYYAAYLIRFDRLFGVYYYRLFVDSLPIVIGCYLLSFFVVGIYRGVWRYVSAADILTHLKGVFLGTTLTVIALVFLFRFEGYSRGVIVINAMTLAILTIGSRVSFRLVAEVTSRRRIRSGQRTLIYGAGDGGALLLRELRNNQHYHFQPVGFVDDDERKHQRRILGLSVLGGSDNLEAIIAESGAEVVIISTSCLDDDRASRVAQVCFESGTGLLRMDLTLQQFSPRHPHASPGAGA